MRRPRQYDDDYDDVYRYERFITTIQQRAGISWEKAEHAARATLRTLAERISAGEARDLAADLPTPLREWLLAAGQGDAERFGLNEFVRRVAEREQVDTETAERHARAVLVALGRLVRGDEIADLVAELPNEYAPLIGGAARVSRDPLPPEALPLDEFLERVRGRAGLDRDAALRATNAVLETLAARIAGGEVDDLAAYLPEDLRAALMRGKEASGGRARRMSLDEFVANVAEREDATWEDALEHTRAVFTTLREALPDKELADVLAQLPRGYSEALL
jgi:uncharacterized protein (DUF2267 family)